MHIKVVSFACAALLALTATAHAATIDYIFIGDGTGTLGGNAFDGAFTVVYVGDTTAVTSGGPNFFFNTSVGTFSTATLSAAMNSGTEVVLNTSAGFPALGFAQSQPAPIFSVNEAVVNSAFESYDLTTAFAQTSGTVSFLPQTYLTASGDLSFSSISSLSFEATTPSAVPLPSSVILFMTALSAFGLLGYQRNRTRSNAA